MTNQRGGIISTIFVIPIGLVLMIGIFFLGYYVGKYKSGDGKENQLPPLPEIVSNTLAKKEEFTFFKTLSDRENKTVTLDLKPRLDSEKNERKEPFDPNDGIKSHKTAPQVEKNQDVRIQTAKKEPVITRTPGSKLRYTLQIASYQDKQMAEEEVRKIKQQGYAAFIATSEIEGKGTWYRVRLGSFSARQAAEKLQKELRSKNGITPLITIE